MARHPTEDALTEILWGRWADSRRLMGEGSAKAQVFPEIVHGTSMAVRSGHK